MIDRPNKQTLHNFDAQTLANKCSRRIPPASGIRLYKLRCMRQLCRADLPPARVIILQCRELRSTRTCMVQQGVITAFRSQIFRPLIPRVQFWIKHFRGAAAAIWENSSGSACRPGRHRTSNYPTANDTTTRRICQSNRAPL